MLIRCMQSENKKLKHSILWLACFIIPLIPAIMGTFNYLGNLAFLTPGWHNLWTQETLFYANFFGAPLMGLCCAYLWRLEHRNHNWNALMTAPVPVWATVLSKLMVALRFFIMTQLWMGTLFLVTGKCIGVDGPVPMEILGYLLRGTLAGAAVATLQLFLSMVIPSFTLPVILAFIGSVGSIYITAKGLGFLSPYALLMLGMNANHAQDMLKGQLLSFLAAAAGFALLFYLLSIAWLRKKDIRA
ncbi:MAG: ABC transporter permease subunit [Lachnospiraceae bacterium]|nr:ABC transporter permease subunit [Lachnospiraceae bacterium]